MPNREELSAARSPKRSQGFDRGITMRILVWIAKIAIAGLLKSWKSDDSTFSSSAPKAAVWFQVITAVVHLVP